MLKAYVKTRDGGSRVKRTSRGAAMFPIAGGADRHATLDETNLIFKNANEPKELWVINDAGHVDFHAKVPDEYERRVLEFLSRTLKRPNQS